MIVAAVVLLGIPHLMRLLERRGHVGALVPVTLALAVLGSLLFGLSLVQQSLAGTVAFLLAGYGMLAGGVNAIPSIAVGLTAPAAYRGRLVAIGGTTMGLVAMGLGPYLAALIAGRLDPGPRAIANAMLVLTVIAAPLAGLCFALAWAPFRRAMAPGPRVDLDQLVPNS
jgi:MFS family permease